MHQNLRRSLALSLAAGWAAPASLLSRPVRAATATQTLQVGFVYVSPIGDAGWTFQHEQGRRQMERVLGPAVATRAVENVPEGPDAERVLRELALEGCGLVFATSFGYLEPALRVARAFPGTMFMHAGGYKTAPNLGTYIGRYYEARYLAGVLAGMVSRSGRVGYVAGFPVPEVVQGINAFTLGLRAVQPQADVQVLWLNTWFDPTREREAALTLVRQGADVLTHHSGSSAVAAAAEAAGVRVLPYPSDMQAVAPRAQLAAIVHEWGGFYTGVARSVLERRWSPTPVWGSMREGFMRLTEAAADVPAAARGRLAQAQADLLSGRLQPFAGPLLDRQGRERLPAGRALSDREIQGMDWYVSGVRLPG